MYDNPPVSPNPPPTPHDKDVDCLRAYFRSKFGNLGVDNANDLLRAMEKLETSETVRGPIAQFKSDLAGLVMLGGGGVTMLVSKAEKVTITYEGKQ